MLYPTYKSVIDVVSSQPLVFVPAILAHIFAFFGTYIVTSAKHILYTFAGILSIIVMLFVSIFPIITTTIQREHSVTLGKLMNYLKAPSNAFVVLLIQIITCFNETNVMNSHQEIKKVNIENTSTKKLKSDKKIIQSAEFYAQFIPVLMTFLTLVYLYLIHTYELSSNRVLYILMAVYVILFIAQLYYKHYIHQFYSIFVTDDFYM